MKKISFKKNQDYTILEVNLESIVNALLKFCFKQKFLEVVILPIFIVNNIFFNFNPEIQIQDIKKESLQYEFCLETETYCMIHLKKPITFD